MTIELRTNFRDMFIRSISSKTELSDVGNWVGYKLERPSGWSIIAGYA